jgi:peptidoglycan hydrolase-like protein with peptidoglycan-binding domain
MDTFRADVKKSLKGTSLSSKEPSSLQKGDQGKKVTDLQKRLNLMKIRLALAFNTLDEDGIFGEKTKEAVRAFQASRNLTVDGIVGEKTATALSYNYGDVTADGKVTADDVLKVLQGVVGEKKLTAKQTKIADMNANGKVDLEDAQAILNQAVKKR